MMYFNSPYSFMQSAMYNQGVAQGFNTGYNQIQQNQNNNIIFVQGEVGAKSFQLQPNQSVMLLDNDDSKFYIKTTDSTGMSTLKSYRFEEIKDASRGFIENKYVTKEDIICYIHTRIKVKHTIQMIILYLTPQRYRQVVQ